jgi:hypothetical protein
MYICNKCYQVVEDKPCIITRYSSRDYDNYSPDDCEEFDECDCGGRFVEAIKCEICGDLYPEDEVHGGNMCRDCIENEINGKEYEYALEIGEDNKTDVYINGLIPSLLTPEEINKILLDYIEANKGNIKGFDKKCNKYCLEDIDCLADYVEEKVLL